MNRNGKLTMVKAVPVMKPNSQSTAVFGFSTYEEAREFAKEHNGIIGVVECRQNDGNWVYVEGYDNKDDFFYPFDGDEETCGYEAYFGHPYEYEARAMERAHNSGLFQDGFKAIKEWVDFTKKVINAISEANENEVVIVNEYTYEVSTENAGSLEFHGNDYETALAVILP